MKSPEWKRDADVVEVIEISQIDFGKASNVENLHSLIAPFQSFNATLEVAHYQI